MHFLGFPLGPSMQIGCTLSTLHWLVGSLGCRGQGGGTLRGDVSPGTGTGVLGQVVTFQRALVEWELCSTCSCITELQQNHKSCKSTLRSSPTIAPALPSSLMNHIPKGHIKHLLNPSRDGDFATALGSLCQWDVFLRERKHLVSLCSRGNCQDQAQLRPSILSMS